MKALPYCEMKNFQLFYETLSQIYYIKFIGIKFKFYRILLPQEETL